MPGIYFEIEAADREKVRRAARSAGLSQRQFCRRAVLEAADGHADVPGMVRAIYKAVCGRDALPPEAADAVAALVELGLTRAVARRRVDVALKDSPEATAAELIAAALRERTQ